MQSFIQYRRFRTAVEKQHNGAKEKVSNAAQNAPNDQPQSPASSEDKDVEKGDSGSEYSQHQSGVASGPAGETVLESSHGRDIAHPREEVEEPREEEEQAQLSEEDVDQEMRQTLSRMSTQRPGTSAMQRTLTGIEIRKRSTKEGGEGNVFIVGYHHDQDQLNPHNWSYTSRIFITFMVASIGFVVGVASSIDSSALPHAAAEFGVSEVAESLATGMYLIGFGAGALFAGPFSETVGRNPVYITTMVLYMIFIMASGLAPNFGAQIAFRFLAGFFGSTPLTCAGGSLSDIWGPFERVYAFPVFANGAFLGPILGPVMGGYIVSTGVLPSWRWTEWITLIMSGVVLTLVTLLLPETFPPVLLKWKAAHLRAITGDDRYRAEVEVRMDPFLTRLGRALYRPFLLTATEPIILLVALYLTVIYIILFTFLDGYTYIFQDIHRTSEGVTGLCFLGIAIGLCLASILVPIIASQAKRELHKIREAGGDRLPPEFRLWFSMYGAPAIPISLFWMGWTSDSSISIWSPLAASVLFGYGILTVFISSYQYVIDSYEIYAASALASVTLIRYVAAGGMTVVGVSLCPPHFPNSPSLPSLSLFVISHVC